MAAEAHGITIRPAARYDIGDIGSGGIRDLFNIVRRTERQAGRSPLSPPAYAEWLRRIDAQTQRGPHEALIALKGQAVIGFCLARHDPRRAVTILDKLFVHPDAQGQGIGRLLTSHITISAQIRGQRSIELKAESGAGRANGFYKHLGYELVETRAGTPPVDILRRAI